MDKLRTPLFLIAIILLVVIVLIELGSSFLAGDPASIEKIALSLAGDPEITSALSDVRGSLNRETPPGLAIPFLAFLDGLLVFTVALMGASFLLSDRFQGRIQGIITLIVSLLILITAVILIFITLAKVLLMIGLFLAAPFGTIAYVAVWGFFERAGAASILGLLMLLKLGAGVTLILAHQRFVQNKGLVLLILTSLAANLVISFLHAFVPGPLVSITDGIAAIVILILAAIWAIVLLIGSVISVIKAIA